MRRGTKVDLNKPIEIAEDVFWVGYVVPEDLFQCHVYLIRNEDQSILIDPGSMIVFPIVLEKILQVTSLRNIKYIIMHHQDPDITGCFSTLESIMPPAERYVVTHWRAEALLRHHKWQTPFYLVDQNEWHLTAGSRELEFVFTPYAHFPGAFCTFDRSTRTLFSSDIFGALSEKFFLFAEENEEYYRGIELFHKHYMPSKLVLNNAMERIEKKQPDLIVPQHGSIIRKEMIAPVINRLKGLDCGLYMLDEEESDIFTLNRIDEFLKNFFDVLLSPSDIKEIGTSLFKNLKMELYSIRRILIVGRDPKHHKEMLVADITENGFSEELLANNRLSIPRGYSYKVKLETNSYKVGELYIYSDKLKESEVRYLTNIFSHIKYPLVSVFEKEISLELLERDREVLWQRSVIDPLTRLYNRGYLFNFLRRALRKSTQRNSPLSLATIDIDHFKKINDTYGHLIGDCILRRLGEIFRKSFRKSDCVARYGGEEFVVVMPNTELKEAYRKMERLRREIAETSFCRDNLRITVSIGVTEHKDAMSIKQLLRKADENLYKAKDSGRNSAVFG